MNYQNRSTKPLAILTFLLGLTILLLSFFLAYKTFSIPPNQLLGLKMKQEIDLNLLAPEATKILLSLFYKTIMLLVMIVIGSVITHKGIKLYQSQGLWEDHQSKTNL